MTHAWGSSVECLFLLCEVLTHAVKLCTVTVPERRDKKPRPAPAVHLQAALHEPLSRGAGVTLNGGIQPEVQASEGSRGQLTLPRHRSQGTWSLQRLRVQSGGSAPPPPPAASLSHCPGVAVG